MNATGFLIGPSGMVQTLFPRRLGSPRGAVRAGSEEKGAVLLPVLLPVLELVQLITTNIYCTISHIGAVQWTWNNAGRLPF